MTYEQFTKLNPEGEIYNKTYTNYLSAKLSHINNYMLSISDNMDELLKFEKVNNDLLNIMSNCLELYIEKIELFEDLEN